MSGDSWIAGNLATEYGRGVILIDDSAHEQPLVRMSSYGNAVKSMLPYSFPEHTKGLVPTI